MKTEGVLNAKWDSLADSYDAHRSCWLNTRRRLYLVGILKELTQDGARLLEIGSGTGLLTRELAQDFPKLTFQGIEPNGDYVAYSKRLAAEQNIQNVNYTVSTAETLGERLESDAPFEVVLSNDVLHHVVDMDTTCEQIAARSRPGTRWIAIEPNCLNPYVAFRQGTIPGERNYLPWKGRVSAERAGWKLVESRYIFLIPPFIRQVPGFVKILERVFERFPLIAGGVVQVFEKV